MSSLNRHRYILDFAISSLLRRKKKNAAMVFVYTLIVFVFSSVIFFTHAIKKEALFVFKDAPEMIVQRIVAGRHDLMPINYAEKIKGIRGVVSVKGRLWGYYFDPIIGANYTLMVSEDFQYELGEIIIGNGVSRTRLAYKGDIMTFRGFDGVSLNLKISDILPHESELASADLILMSETDFRRLFGITSSYFTDLTVQIRNSREVVTIARKITESLPDARPIIRDEILRTYDSVFNWRSGLMAVILSGALLSFIIFAMDKASGLSADEKREIGILKAIGWETSDVIWLKFWEGAVVSGSSFITGILLAYIHVFFASASLFEPVLKGWSTLYPDFKLTPFIDPYQIVTLFFLTVAPYTMATIIPSWRAATIDPDTVMRA